MCDCAFLAKNVFSLDSFFFHDLSTRGSCYSLEAVRSPVRISRTLHSEMTVVSTPPTFAYISFKYAPVAETKI